MITAPAACVDDAPLPTAAGATAGLAIAARVSTANAAASTVAIRVSYLRAATATVAAPQEVLLLSREVSVGTGPQQVPVAVDLTRCLADPQRAAPTNACQLRVVLRLLVNQAVADSAALAPIAVRPGQTATVPEPVSLVAVASITIRAVYNQTFDGPFTDFAIAGSTRTLLATARDANGNVLTNRTVTWASSNTSVATINPAGIVSGIFPGATTITATSGATTAQLPLNVYAGSITVSPATATVAISGTQQLTATVLDANKRVLNGVPVTWESSAPTLARVSSTGLVTGVNISTSTTATLVTITAKAAGAFGTSTITVVRCCVVEVTGD